MPPSLSVIGVFERVFQEFVKMRPMLPTYLHLIASAIFPIYTAAHASLRRPVSAAPVSKKRTTRRTRVEEDDGEEEASSPIEALTTSDAIMFPILAGAMLTILYFIIKWLEDPALLNKILGYYFSWGILHEADTERNAFHTRGTPDASAEKANTNTLKAAFVDYILLPISSAKIYWRARQFLHDKTTCVATTRKPLSSGSATFRIDRLDILAAAASATIALLTLTLKRTPWYLTNLSGFSFCYGTLQIMTPGTSATGSLLLSLLFFYDIYMVFFTPMMVTVATKLDVPIKLLFPRPADTFCPKPIDALPGSQEMEEYLKCLSKQRTMAMLGLGDIVVPGILIAFALRFDLYNYYLKLVNKNNQKIENIESEEKNNDKKDARPLYQPARGMWAERFYTARGLWSSALQARSFPKPYFKATMAGYTAGLIATLLVMQVYKHAQPALLYLVPGVLAGFWGMALWRREVKLLWQYDETEDEQKKKEKQSESTSETVKKDGKSEKDVAAREEDEEKDDARSRSDAPQPAFSFDVYMAPRESKALVEKED
ncbi:hypothetical protein LTR64_005516 [Lithohypha guttulata]|uniref:Uncharacterized protein n=1 Tax=Lithohypha guttulata TaxID=1690604 RepID=A0AAN7SVR7_9EURO|nr:hypothetical protein LTR51_002691 [Lithohypha guttulata]KAK5082874.1 hypothetical protein LTR05_006755 [Lithohypha guttulata]